MLRKERALELFNQGMKKKKVRDVLVDEGYIKIIGVDDNGKNTLEPHRRMYEVTNKKRVAERTMVQSYDNLNSETVLAKEENGVHEITYSGEKIITKEEFLKHINFDDSKDEILSFNSNRREVIQKVSKNETKIVPKYEHFLRTKPISGFNVDKILHRINTNISSITYPKYEIIDSGKALELCIFDPHINKRSFNGEERTLVKAKEVYINMIQEMCIKAKRLYTYEEVVLVIGNDTLNSDAHGKTTSGTPQDNTSDEETAFEVWLDIIMTSVNIIQENLGCNIRIISVPGNHAEVLEQIMGTTINAIYRNDKSITVDYTPSYRKYWNFGKAGVMFCHGEGKKDTYPMLRANEQPQLWADTNYRYVHCGHIHSLTVQEINGVVIETLSSITTDDRRHSKNGYVLNKKGGQMFIRDKEKGQECKFNFMI